MHVRDMCGLKDLSSIKSVVAVKIEKSIIVIITSMNYYFYVVVISISTVAYYIFYV